MTTISFPSDYALHYWSKPHLTFEYSFISILKAMMLYSRKVRMTFEDVIEKVTQNLRSQGFGIITSIDIQDTFKKTFDIRFRKYQILGACHPRFAYKAISLESHLGVALSCTVVVQEHENGEIEVSAVNPLENMDKSFNTLQLEDLAVEMGVRLRAAIDYIQRELPCSHGLAIPPGQKTCGCEATIKG